jgi:5-oxopent-3-ene-1,2,5-tricarboxylate decarboxylase/2-hydroxyhepta-2,4-diene-1,7-dioate isomerase
LYVKPANTLVGSGAAVRLPEGAESVEVGATIGVVIGRAASRLTSANAAAFVAGYVLVADLSLPHGSYYRPAIREKCFDGACVVGTFIPASEAGDIAELVLTTRVDDKLVSERALNDFVRDVPNLLADVTQFMTLNAGDVLLTGVAYMAPQARAGSRVQVSAPRVGSLDFSIHAFAQGEPR